MKRVVYYPGNFDMLHYGHIDALNKAKQIAGPDGELICAVNADRFSVSYKRLPVNHQDERVADLIKTGIPDRVILNPGFNAQLPQMLANKTSILIAGEDWANDPDTYARQLYINDLGELWDQHKIVLVYLSRTSGISTTKLVEQQ